MSDDIRYYDHENHIINNLNYKSKSDNIYHRYLNLPLKFEKPVILDTVKPNFSELLVFENSKLQLDNVEKFLNSLGLYNHRTDCVYSKPSSKTAFHIHSDTDKFSNHVKLAFSWGSELSKTIWWKPKKNSYVKKVKMYFEDQKRSNIKCSKFKRDTLTNILRKLYKSFFLNKKFRKSMTYLHAKEKDCIKVLERTIDRPSIYNVGQLHSTSNISNEDRWTLAIEVYKKKDKKPLTFNEALEYFKNYIDTDYELKNGY